MSVYGTCSRRFAKVRQEFERNFTERGEVGASVCVQVRGETEVDLWGGDAIPATGTAGAVPWQSDTVGKRLVVHEGGHRAVRSPAHRPRPARPERAGQQLLAGVRGELRQGQSPGPAAPQPLVSCARNSLTKYDEGFDPASQHRPRSEALDYGNELEARDTSAAPQKSVGGSRRLEELGVVGPAEGLGGQVVGLDESDDLVGEVLA